MSRDFDSMANESAADCNSASMDDPNDVDSMSKEILASLDASDTSSSVATNHHQPSQQSSNSHKQLQHQQQQQQQQQRVPPTYIYSTSCSEQEDIDNNGGINSHHLGQHHSRHHHHLQLAEDQLGPLPLNWEKAFTETGEVYFIDHNTGTSHWLDPRLSKFQKRSLEECRDDELPYGWEKIDDNLYGTYFIDHVNRRTQYENPVIQAKRAQQMLQNSINERNKSSMFTRNPDALKGQRIRTTLVKSSRGLGFTIIGGDENCQEFLQIKSVVPNGPAWLDGKLQTGDVLVYVNDTCVLGFTHNEMVDVFKSIASGETVSLEVCRGYQLPFDPNDPNTEVVTTIAVNTPDILTEERNLYMDLERSAMQSGNDRFEYLDPSFLPVHHNRNGLVPQQNGENLASNVSVNSMPDLCISDKLNSISLAKRPNSTDILLNDSVDHSPNEPEIPQSPVTSKPSEFFTIPIVKGITGFGFTIADSAHGQKVKKILDRDRCKNLMENDVLVSINDINVRNMSHAEVVQVLKDCCRDQEALIYVQRSGALKSPLLEKDGKDKPIFDFFRSKTPTADIYSTQTKTIVPQRPKTPLIDTRNNKTCSPLPPQQPLLANVQPQRTANDIELQEALDARYNKFNERDYANQVIYGYTDVPYKSRESHLADDFSGMNLSGLDVEENLREVLKQRQNWISSNGEKVAYGTNDLYAIDVDHHPQSPIDNHHIIPKQNGIHHHHQQPMADYYKDVYSTVTQPRYEQDQLHADYTLLCQGQEQNVDTGEFWDKQKESTSFEHEQPLSSAIMPRYANFADNVNELVCTNIPDIEWIETLVTLVRQDNGFGFRIVGGTEEGTQVSVGHIVPGGAADLDGRLSSGDYIVSVDGECVLNSSHHRVVQLMVVAAQNGRVTLGIRRRIVQQDHMQQREQHAQSVASSYGCRGVTLPMGHVQYPYEVTVTREENEGFGFVIISSVNKAGSTIGRIIEGSPAERCGRLNIGDYILAVNHVDISSACHKDIVNLIKDSGYSVTLTIGYPLDDCCSSASLSQKDEIMGDGDGGQYHAVELTRGTRGFGFSIRGGREFQNMPLFVLQIAENGPASIDNRLRVGDQMIEINGINTKNMTHTEAIEIIRNGGPTVRLLVRRGGCQMPSVVGASSHLYDMNI